MKLEQTSSFQRAYKRLHKGQRKEVNQAIKALMEDPLLGEMKVGDLAGIRIHKFRMNKQLTLLTYIYAEEILTLTLLTLGTHENFYRDLKR